MIVYDEILHTCIKKVMCLTMVPGGDKVVWGKANKLK